MKVQHCERVSVTLEDHWYRIVGGSRDRECTPGHLWRALETWDEVRNNYPLTLGQVLDRLNGSTLSPSAALPWGPYMRTVWRRTEPRWGYLI